ncbi:hypothetical protein [Burkholderia plantarii]|uniref:hypothetical protein n=1 Tax=Burkholderia plantarii TaxID=41899 RepID=UPI0011E06462|nr:hypothetical protein [Burkholderia plantarii]
MMKVMGLFAFQRISIAIAFLPRRRIRQPGAASRAVRTAGRGGRPLARRGGGAYSLDHIVDAVRNVLGLHRAGPRGRIALPSFPIEAGELPRHVGRLRYRGAPLHFGRHRTHRYDDPEQTYWIRHLGRDRSTALTESVLHEHERDRASPQAGPFTRSPSYAYPRPPMKNGPNPAIQAVMTTPSINPPHCAFAATCPAPLPPPT